MIETKYIIEVNESMTMEQQKLLEKFFEGMLDINDITIYKANEYSKNSIFADTIYNEINQEIAKEYNCNYK